MRVALLSDIHANLAALDAVLRDAESEGADAWWHLGDVVGYGPEPDAVIARLVELGAKGVMGNHDAAAIGELSLAGFNPLAAAANRWTATHISPESRDFLAALPRVRRENDATLVHGSLREPLWEYLSTYDAARAHFDLQETPLSFVGHTHLPLVIGLDPAGSGEVSALSPGDGEVVALGEGKTCVNPGGVGQPRDGDPRACYAIFDTAARTVLFRRVEYDIAATQARMCDHNLPAPLIDRLSRGR